MNREVGEECGVAAISLRENNAPEKLYKLLLDMQNRGQLSAGITTFNKDRHQLIDTYKDLGTVNEVFKTARIHKTEAIFNKYTGNRGIGHIRYATSGSEDRSKAQPFERHHGRKWKWFTMAFNGNIVNYMDLKKELESNSYYLMHNNDTEVIMHNISRALMGGNRPDLVEVFSDVVKNLDGAYNIVYMNAYGEIVVLRDPLGFKPLTYYAGDDRVVAASESNALFNSGYTNFKDLPPGKMLIIDESGHRVETLAKSNKTSHCIFEWVYFSNVGSVIEGKSVYLTRIRLGRELAKMETEKVNDDYVILPVPDTAKSAASGFAHELGLPLQEGLIRNRYVGRTFINGETKRENDVEVKFTAIKDVLKGKKLLVVDDSIVRGNTSKRLVKFLRERGGAKEVHLRISCPPIVRPCFYGIDMSTVDELIAARHIKNIENGITEKETESLAKEIGADSIIYQDIPNLVKSIKMQKNELCLACLNGDYPTKCGKGMCLKAIDNSKNGKSGRTYEQS